MLRFIRISQGKGGKDRIVPFPDGFKETLALHFDAQHAKNATFLFESSWKKPHSGHASRQSLEIYSRLAFTDAQDSYQRAIDRFPV